MASIARRPDGRWRARYRDPDGRERAKHFDRKADAQRFIADVEASKLRGTYVDPTSRTTVTEYALRWAAARPFRPRTRRRVDQQIARIARTSLGRLRLVGVLPSDVQSWVATLSADGLAPSTVRLHVNLLSAVFRAAVLDRLIGSSPVVRLTLPRAERGRIVPLTVAQVRALADEVPERDRALVIAQAGLGLRVGELLALRVPDVDFLRRTVRVEHQLTDLTRERVEPKTSSSRRTVPLPEFVAVELARHIERWPPLGDGSLFYGTHDRRPLLRSSYTQRFKRAARRLAAAKGSTFPASTSTHDLRHHYASVLLAGGESVIAVAERLGHDDASMVLRVYGHLMPGSEDRTRRVVDAAWSTGDTGVRAVAQGGRVADSTRTLEAP